MTRKHFEAIAYALRRQRPEPVPLFRRILRCHCGAYMTALQDRDAKYDAYRCSRGLVEPSIGLEGRRKVTATHPHGISVPERVVRDWAMEEAAKFDQVALTTARSTGPVVSVAELSARKDRAGRACTRGALDETAFEDELREIERLERELAAQAGARRFLQLRRGVRWDISPAAAAADVKRLWRAIHLDEHIRPVRADWRARPPLTDDEVVLIERPK